MRHVYSPLLCVTLIWAALELALPAATAVNVTPSTNATTLADTIVGSTGVMRTGVAVLKVGTSTNSSGLFTTTGSNLGLARGVYRNIRIANDGIWDTLAPGAAVIFTWPHTVTQAEVDHG